MADIRFDGVSKSYGQVGVIDGLDLDIASGEFIVLLGESGCGKTTLLRMLAGLETISAGTISVGDRVVNDLEPKDRGCAMVFQNYALFPHMSVRQNLSYGMKLAKVEPSEREARIGEAARMLNIAHLLDRRPSQLSGGQRQRVAIGRAMVRRPLVFLFDEPLSNLDAKLRTETRIELRRLHDQLGSTSIFVTHDQAEAMTLADRIVVMNKGRIEQIGTPDEVYHRPATRFVASFIGSPPANIFELAVDDEHGIPTVVLLGTRYVLPASAKRLVRVVAAVRPENLCFDSQGAQVSLVAVENLGNIKNYHFQREGVNVVVSASQGEALAASETAISPRADTVLFYGQDGGLLQ